MRAILHCLALGALAVFTGTSWGGPNANGVLIVHANPPDQFSSCVYEHEGSFCSLNDRCVALDACEHAITRVNGSSPQVWTVIAAFPSGASPRYVGLTFGLRYPAGLAVVTVENCADFELSDSNWPASSSGTALVWNTTQTDPLGVIYAFSGYNDGPPALFEVTAHPTQGGYFGDDSIPSVLDPIAGYGALGFDQPGVLVCPSGTPPQGACCLPSGDCLEILASECAAQGGTYLGDGVSCQSANCPAPTGACCVDLGQCMTLSEADCVGVGGAYQGDGTSCSPNPCAELFGACCLFNGVCVEGTESYCAEQLGSFEGSGSDCDPNPCPPGGACCLPSGACRLFTEYVCEFNHGSWMGPGSSCDEIECTPQLQGACCFDNGTCFLVYGDECVAGNGLFQGDGTPCEPSPCPPLGACCLPDRCTRLWESECLAMSGAWIGPNTDCDPYPCPGPAGGCCLPDESCVFVLPSDCFAAGGTFLGPNVTCESWDCSGGVPVGACCIILECQILSQDSCWQNGGNYIGDGTSCDPTPCYTVPTRHATWGGIKARYR